MTILVCIPCLLTGGTEIQTLNLVHALARGGHRVVTACYFEHAPRMVERYRQAGSEVVLFEPEGQRIGGWRGAAFLYRHLRQCVRQYRPEAAHVQYMAPGAQPIILLKLLGVKHILATAHTDARIYRSLRLPHFLCRHALDVFICITCRAEEQFFGSSRLYTEATPLQRHSHFTIYNSLPPHVQTAERERPSHTAPVTIGVVSRLEHIKGMDLVIPAFARVLRQHPDARLLVVGEGSLRPLMERQAGELGVTERVEWAGRQPQEHLQAYYDRIDIFWMPSRSEGFGLSALEAMARGCAVVAAEVGGLPELLQDGASGVLFPGESAEELANASLSLLETPARRQRLSGDARRRAGEFSQERYSSLILNLYEKVAPCLS